MTSLSPRWLAAAVCAAAAFLNACSKPAEPAPAPAPEPKAAVAEPVKATAFVTVLYHPPKDPAAFEKYYWDTHVPLVGQKQAEIGFTAAELTRFVGTADGQPSPYYRQAVLWFADAAARDKGLASAGFKAVGDDLANFADGGLIAMVGELAGEPAPLLSGDAVSFLTVLYKQPTDPAAFEAYYAGTHMPLVGQHAQEIGFSRAELSTFGKSLDGTPPAFYRQAKLYFPTLDALKAGTGTAGFKAVGDDLPKFATGGLVALVGHLTSGPEAPAPASP